MRYLIIILVMCLGCTIYNAKVVDRFIIPAEYDIRCQCYKPEMYYLVYVGTNRYGKVIKRDVQVSSEEYYGK